MAAAVETTPAFSAKLILDNSIRKCPEEDAVHFKAVLGALTFTTQATRRAPLNSSGKLEEEPGEKAYNEVKSALDFVMDEYRHPAKAAPRSAQQEGMLQESQRALESAESEFTGSCCCLFPTLCWRWCICSTEACSVRQALAEECCPESCTCARGCVASFASCPNAAKFIRALAEECCPDSCTCARGCVANFACCPNAAKLIRRGKRTFILPSRGVIPNNQDPFDLPLFFSGSYSWAPMWIRSQLRRLVCIVLIFFTVVFVSFYADRILYKTPLVAFSWPAPLGPRQCLAYPTPIFCSSRLASCAQSLSDLSLPKILPRGSTPPPHSRFLWLPWQSMFAALC